MEFRSLFGDNMCVMLPPDFTDVSTMREVPDNQEVFIHTKTDQSIILDILEHVSEPDEQAIRTHLEELANSNDSTRTEVVSLEAMPLEALQLKQCQSAYFLSSKQMVSKFNENAQNVINVYLGLFRLPQHDTDILLSFNDPIQISADSSSHGPVAVSTQPWTLDQFKQVISSLQILNMDFLGQA